MLLEHKGKPRLTKLCIFKGAVFFYTDKDNNRARFVTLHHSEPLPMLTDRWELKADGWQESHVQPQQLHKSSFPLLLPSMRSPVSKR